MKFRIEKCPSGGYYLNLYHANENDGYWELIGFYWTYFGAKRAAIKVAKKLDKPYTVSEIKVVKANNHYYIKNMEK